MAYSQSDLEKLEAALAKGEKSIQYADKKIEYFTHEELVKRIAYVKKQIKKSKNPFGLQFQVSHDKGLR